MDGDKIVSLCLHWLNKAKPVDSDVRVVGRTWNLKSVYKQLAARSDRKRFAAICVVDPGTNEVQLADGAGGREKKKATSLRAQTYRVSESSLLIKYNPHA